MHGLVLPPDLFVTAIRLRLSADIIAEPVLCNVCGKHLLDTQCKHSQVCAIGAATIGHNRVRDALHYGFACSDPGANIETPGLIPSAPSLRPADIFTVSAVPNQLSAVDVGITSPENGGAGEDCTQAMYDAKVLRYSAFTEELRVQGIEYLPAMFSSYGRRQRSTSNIMIEATRKAARLRGLSDHRLILKRWHCTVTAELRYMRCLPQPDPQSEWILEGDGVADGGGIVDGGEEGSSANTASAAF